MQLLVSQQSLLKQKSHLMNTKMKCPTTLSRQMLSKIPLSRLNVRTGEYLKESLMKSKKTQVHLQY